MKSLRAILGWTLLLVVHQSQGGSISDSLMEKFSSGASTQNAILELPSVMSDVLSNPILQMLSGDAKTNMMISLAQQFTSAAQAPFMQAISSMGISATPFWASNDIALKDVSLPALQSLASVPGPFTIREPVTVTVNPVVVNPEAPALLSRKTRQTTTAQWGVTKIGAPTVWSSKTKGAGVLVANIDSGVNGYHEALKGNYAGQWYDPVSGTKYPYDGHGHGTHTMGTICGQTQGIGVAPDAKWVACRGLDSQGSGTEANLKACGQWILNLTSKPRVVSNSWGGGQSSTFYNDIITMWKNAGILPVFSIGNSGPNCKTANSPGDQSVAWSVGSTKQDDTMSSFSSRGPSNNTQKLLKPEISAPGDQIVSAYISSNSSYVYMSGTSMAGKCALSLNC